MSERTPQQEVLDRFETVSNKVRSLQSDVRLSSLRDSVEDLDSLTNGLPDRVKELRKQGYVYGKGFEGRATNYANQWRMLRLKVVQEIDRQAPLLEQEMKSLETEHARVRAGTSNPLLIKNSVGNLASRAEAFEDKVGAVKSSIQGMYDSMQSDADAFKSALEKIDEMLKAFAAAAAAGSFRLLPTEGAVAAVKAVFSRDQKMDKDDPEGILFLTDQRLLFEQNQEIATKKVLFVVTEKQKVQKLVFETPIALIETAQASKKGLFGHEDHLAMAFKSGAPMYQAWFHLEGQDSNEMQELIGKVCSGGMETERAVAIDQAQVDKVKAAPSQCPNCGAPIRQVVLRGMDSLTCEYCQYVIRL